MYVPLGSRRVAELLTRSEVHDAITNRGSSVTAVRVTPGDLVEQPEAYLDDIPGGGNVVNDTVDELERGGHGADLDFLNRLKQDLTAAEAIGVVRCLTGSEAANRWLTLDRVDLVWKLRIDIITRDVET